MAIKSNFKIRNQLMVDSSVQHFDTTGWVTGRAVGP